MRPCSYFIFYTLRYPVFITLFLLELVCILLCFDVPETGGKGFIKYLGHFCVQHKRIFPAICVYPASSLVNGDFTPLHSGFRASTQDSSSLGNIMRANETRHSHRSSGGRFFRCRLRQVLFARPLYSPAFTSFRSY